MRSSRWLLVAGMLLAAPPARAEDARAAMAQALEAAADVDPGPPALPTVSPIAQTRDAVTPRPGPREIEDRGKAARASAAAASAHALAASLARAVRAAASAASEASDHAARERAHGRERPARGVER